MQMTELLDSVNYITDPQGQKKGVQLSLDVWQRLVRFVKEAALLQKDDLTDSAISKHAEGVVSTDMTERDAAMYREEAAFRSLHPSLYKQHAGEYVAIYNEELVDSDLDQVALYLRARKKYPGQFVWIAPVRKTPDEVLYFRSPRFLNGNQ